MPDVRCPGFHMAAFLYTRAPTSSGSLPQPPPPPSLSLHFSSRLCCLKPEPRWQKRNEFLAECGGKGQISWAVRTFLNHKTPIINGNGETDPSRLLLEGLFVQIQNLEERTTEDHQKEEDLQDAERSLFLEYSELNLAKEELKQQEEEMVLASSRQKRLEEEMGMVNLALASQVIFIDDLKLTLNGRDKEVLAVECDLSRKEDEIERVKMDLATKSEEAAIEELEYRSRVNLLDEANEILKRQEGEVSELEREIRVKEEELEAGKALEKSEQSKLLAAEANLKQQTTDWFMAREELRKLEEEISNYSGETNGALEDFERVRTLLAEVRFELILSQKAFALSRQEVEDKRRALEKQFEELDAQRGSIESYIMTLKNAKVEVESERVKLRITEARNKEIEGELSVEKKLVVELEKDLSRERSFLEQAVEDILSLKKELDDRNTELVDMENDVRVKDAELVEARLEVQRLMSKHASFQSLLEKKDLELSNVQKVLAVAKEEIFELNIPMKDGEEVQTIDLCSKAESMVDRIVSDTDEVFREPEKPVGNSISRRKQLEKELQLTRESLKEKEMEILASQRALIIKDQELKVVSRKLDSKETELVKIKEEMSTGDLAIEKLELEAAQLEVEAVTNTLEKLAQMSKELLNTSAQSIEADVDIGTLPCYESDSSNNSSSLCIGESEVASEFRTEVANLLALTEQLVIEADAKSSNS